MNTMQTAAAARLAALCALVAGMVATGTDLHVAAEAVITDALAAGPVSAPSVVLASLARKRLAAAGIGPRDATVKAGMRGFTVYVRSTNVSLFTVVRTIETLTALMRATGCLTGGVINATR